VAFHDFSRSPRSDKWRKMLVMRGGGRMTHDRDRIRKIHETMQVQKHVQAGVGANQSITKALSQRGTDQISISISSEEGSPSTPLAQTESYSILSAKKSPTLSRSFLKTSASLLSARFNGTGDLDRGNRVENASWYHRALGQEAHIDQTD
jgi:hypothetical protein